MITFKRILCPVDFSECSRRAFDQALAVARCYGSTVTALHVTSPVHAGVASGAVAGAINRGGSAMATMVERLIESERVPGVTVNVLVEEAPDVSNEIFVQSHMLHADLLVMGTHGRSGFERLFLGSTAERVLRKAHCPVLTIPPGAPDAMPRGPVPFTRILCAVDFSPSSHLAVEYATSLAQEGGGTLTLVHAIEVLPLYYDFSPPVNVDLDAWSADARRRLAAIVPDPVRASLEVSEVVRAGKPYRQILDLAEERSTDLIVMGVQGRGAVDLFLLGSTTRHVLQQSACAVLTLRGEQ